MHDRSTASSRLAAPPAAGATRRVDHLHFDRRARVWRTHAELTREGWPLRAEPSTDPQAQA
jgi:hypothetical protein